MVSKQREVRRRGGHLVVVILAEAETRIGRDSRRTTTHSSKMALETDMKRQAATSKGIQRRVRDLELGRIRDPRQTAKVKHPLSTLLGVLVVSMVTMARSLREVEDRSEQIAQKRGPWLGISQRIADNTFGTRSERSCRD